jgi:hypothetical protein
LVKKPIAIKAAKYQVADIIPLKGRKNGVVVFAELRVEDNEQDKDFNLDKKVGWP